MGDEFLPSITNSNFGELIRRPNLTGRPKRKGPQRFFPLRPLLQIWIVVVSYSAVVSCSPAVICGCS